MPSMYQYIIVSIAFVVLYLVKSNLTKGKGLLAKNYFTLSNKKNNYAVAEAVNKINSSKNFKVTYFDASSIIARYRTNIFDFGLIVAVYFFDDKIALSAKSRFISCLNINSKFKNKIIRELLEIL